MSTPNTPDGQPFGTPASFCDCMTRSFDNRVPPEVRSIIADECILPLGLSPRVLDLGCGPGLWLREVTTLRRDATVVGYDRDPDMLANAARLGISQAEWKQADIGGPSFTLPAASADVIAMQFFFHFFDNPRPLLATVRTALKPGGSLIIIGWVRSSLPAFLSLMGEMGRREGAQSVPVEGRREGDDPEARAWQMYAGFNRYTPVDIRWLLTREGFTVRRDAQYSEYFAYTIASPNAQ